MDGTLYDTRRMRRELLPIFVRRGMRSPLGAWRAARVLRAYRKAHESLRGRRWDDLTLAQLRHAADRLDVDIDEVRRVVEDWFERTPIPAVARAAPPNLPRDLERLRSSGARLAVLSDYPPVVKLEALGVAHLLDHVSWSQRPEIGALKPDPAGLLHTLRSLDVPPERALYVGDRPEVDEAVAISAGCRPMLIGARAPLLATTRVFPALRHFADWFLRAPDE